MFLRKTVENSFTLAVMGLALSGVAVGQVAVPGAGNGNVGGNVQADVNAATNAATPAVDAATSANVNADSNVNTNPGAQVSGDAAARVNGQNINSDVQSDINAGVNSLQNDENVTQTSNAATNANPFGATFDASNSDRLIIRNLQPNSVASRLGLQAGDRIIGFNGQTYTDVNQFDRDLTQLNGTSEVPFIYERNGQRFTQRLRMSTGNGQSGSTGQISYSANRPVYGVSSSNGDTGDMQQTQSYADVNGYGNGSGDGSACCGQAVSTQQYCCVTRHHGHHRAYQHVGRRHRHNCR
jgi:membrane-associated protease RseP (regulator of RpoE activity)